MNSATRSDARKSQELRVVEREQEMLHELLRALGRFDGASPLSPQTLWESALAEVRELRNRL